MLIFKGPAGHQRTGLTEKKDCHHGPCLYKFEQTSAVVETFKLIVSLSVIIVKFDLLHFQILKTHLGRVPWLSAIMARSHQ